MKVRILYDSRAAEGFQADWGFSCLIEGQERVLFDCGANPAILEYNMRAAGVEPSAIDQVVVSHDHWDHVGGLPYVAGAGTLSAVWVTPSFTREVDSSGLPPGLLHEIDGPAEVSPGIHTTGPVGTRIAEQALWLETDSGVVMIVGCGHPGVDALMYDLKLPDSFHCVIGGFHGFRNFEAFEGIHLLVPCHCTQYRQNLAERFPDSYREALAGSEFQF